MSDRVQLEKAEARVLLFSYYKSLERQDKEATNEWLKKEIGRIGKKYGFGFSDRCRFHMRQIANEENK